MFRASSTSSLLKTSSADYVEVEDGDGDDNSTVAVNENSLPAFLQNSQLTSAGSFLWKNEDFKVKDASVNINDWLCREDAKLIRVAVTDPRLVPKKASRRRLTTSSLQAIFAKKSALYVVTVDGLPLTKENEVKFVERSFKDFVVLREVLVRRFPGSCPPPLPRKHTVGNNRDQVVKKRSRLLCLFLQTVADHPFFRNDQVFELFVASTIPFAESLSRFNGFRSEGTERWRQALRAAPLPKDAIHLIENVRAELKDAEKKLANLKSAAKLETEKAIARAVSSSEMVKALDSWLATERTATSPLAGPVQVDVDDGKAKFTTEVSLPDALAPLSRKYANHAAALLHEYGEDQMETSVLDATRFELYTLSTWLDSLDAAQQSERKVVRLTEQLKFMEQQRAGPKAIDTTKKDLDNARYEQARFQRGLLSVELLRLKQARILRALRLKFSITQMHMEGAEAILSVWQGDTNHDEDEDDFDDDEFSLPEPPAPATPVKVKPATPPPPPPPAFDEEKLTKLALTAATKAVEETRAKAEAEEKAAAATVDVHKECKTMGELVDMFWVFVYCTMAIHVFFILVFISRGYVRESIPIVVLAALTFVAGFLVELVHR